MNDVSLALTLHYQRIEKYSLLWIYDTVQGSSKTRSPGLVKLVAALAYHFSLALPAAFPQPGDHILAEPYKTHSILVSFLL